MRGAMPLPLWVVALVLATLAPFAAKMLASTFERRSRQRSQQLLGIGDKRGARSIDDGSRTD
jgi:hypothetical protein